MAKKLKTYETSLGFFDLAIAAPSMKAALEAWGADSNLFHQGAAKQSEDPDVVAATTAKPGVVLKRPVGSNGPFKEHAELPRDLAVDGGAKKAARKAPSRKPQKNMKIDEAEVRKAALVFEKEQARRERERAMEEAAQRKQRERRQKDVDKAQSALDAARRSHDRHAAGIQAEIEDLEEQSRAEEARWGKERSKLEAALRRTRG
jgi:hypothetical protein